MVNSCTEFPQSSFSWALVASTLKCMLSSRNVIYFYILFQLAFDNGWPCVHSKYPFKVKGEGRDLKEGEKRFKPLPECVIRVCCRCIQAKPVSASGNRSVPYQSRAGPCPVRVLGSLPCHQPVKPGRQQWLTCALSSSHQSGPRHTCWERAVGRCLFMHGGGGISGWQLCTPVVGATATFGLGGTSSCEDSFFFFF